MIVRLKKKKKGRNLQSNPNQMILEYVKSKNKKEGRYFYTVHKGLNIIARIHYHPLSGTMVIRFEDDIIPLDKSEVMSFCDKLNGEMEV